MAEKRKLQGDIDRVLKKVADGRATFKETLDKFESSTNNSQKEKHETELKKEIKKLQRLRDHIKNWLASPEIKDKSSLTEARKSIENDMERFKVIEKETKTKAYSKEGLYTETKKDPLQKEKEDHLEWLKFQISKLQKKAEQCDYELVNLNATKRKRSADKDKLNDVTQKLSMYRGHLSKLETLMRLVDNDKIEIDKVRDFKTDFFEDFISNPDGDVYKSDQGLFIYEELNLDELSIDLVINPDLDVTGAKIETDANPALAVTPAATIMALANSSITSPSTVIPNPVISTNHSDKKEEEPVSVVHIEENDTKSFNKSSKKTAKHRQELNDIIPPPPPLPPTSSSSSDKHKTPLKSTTTTPIKQSPIAETVPEPSITSDQPSTTNVVSCQPVKTETTIYETVSAMEEPTQRELLISSDVIIKSTQKVSINNDDNNSFSSQICVTSSVCSNNMLESAMKLSTSISMRPLSDHITAVPTTSVINESSSNTLLLQQQQQQQNELNLQHLTLTNQRAMIDASQTHHLHNYSSQNSASANMMLANSNTNPINTNSSYTRHPSHPPPCHSQSSSSTNMESSSATFDLVLDPGDAMSPFRNVNFKTNDFTINQCMAMELGRTKHQTIQSTDFEKARMIIYKHECPVPESFPREPMLIQPPPPQQQQPSIPEFELEEEYYSRLDSDTLFFIFYYFEGTRAQYLAAKSLKRMSWRFHTGHMCWFQRHEEPKKITENSESGTYIFYDFESMSKQKKENFTFSYNYLEDNDF